MEARDERLDEVLEQFQFREAEIRRLHRLLAGNRVPFALVTGTHNTGKSAVTSRLVHRCFPRRLAWLDCAELCSAKLLYAEVLSKLFPLADSADERLRHLACHNHLEFVELLDERLAEYDRRDRREPADPTGRADYTIVLDNAEYLLRFDNLLSILTRLSELVERPAVSFSVLAISTHQFEYFRQVPNLVIQPVLVNFRPYTLEQTQELIVQQGPQRFPRSPYERQAS